DYYCYSADSSGYGLF
nr:immunoglobulin light chain junction region [Macaca mulatta]MOV66010.1 immunoglobulin light chain junction region [Macaca mulatta]MOV66031.1 immunoglobulin light chain junction region [Macaca mulatta]MOV66069.1 immunoglobulin light chain junction region [Macaca mulatta]MOV66414.1 immunoglobulin light chain junction region [Macaca mulatta]